MSSWFTITEAKKLVWVRDTSTATGTRMSRPTSSFIYISYFTGGPSRWEGSYWLYVPSVSAAPEEIRSSRKLILYK